MSSWDYRCVPPHLAIPSILYGSCCPIKIITILNFVFVSPWNDKHNSSHLISHLCKSLNNILFHFSSIWVYKGHIGDSFLRLAFYSTCIAKIVSSCTTFIFHFCLILNCVNIPEFMYLLFLVVYIWFISRFWECYSWEHFACLLVHTCKNFSNMYT
jgi:hypothetical protein